MDKITIFVDQNTLTEEEILERLQEGPEDAREDEGIS